MEARVLPLPEMPEAILPLMLREDMTLRSHQMYGLAWLQNLYSQVSRKVRGCILADDMGLGKTLQLLCFIVWYLEQAKDSALPVLIVAPVSLLDNWEREFERFFYTHGIPLLKLYGSALADVKLTKGEIPLDNLLGRKREMAGDMLNGADDIDVMSLAYSANPN